MSLLKLLEACE